MPTPTPLSPTHPALKLDNQLCFAVYAASLAMTKAYKPVLGALGLTYPQYLVLLVLWEQDHRPVTELGERLCLDSGTLTPLLKRMESAGWVQRQRSTQDERKVHIVLTPAGLALREQAACIPVGLANKLACDTAELARLTAELHTLRQRLGAA
ncbi:MAG: MarR family transcriptional regulator [Burkholderiaceae bacterium]